MNYFIIDEISLLGCHNFFGVHRRLQKVRLCDEFFGNANIILVGDFQQLKPVIDRPLYSPICSVNTKDNPARILFQDFVKNGDCFELTKN